MLLSQLLCCLLGSCVPHLLQDVGELLERLLITCGVSQRWWDVKKSLAWQRTSLMRQGACLCTAAAATASPSCEGCKDHAPGLKLRKGMVCRQVWPPPPLCNQLQQLTL